VFLTLRPSSALDEDASHRLGGGAEEVSASVPMIIRSVTDEAHERFVHEGGGLKCESRRLIPEPLPGQTPQLFIDDREETASRRRVTGLQFTQDPGDIGGRRIRGRGIHELSHCNEVRQA
jgi:hypothetical protein